MEVQIVKHGRQVAEHFVAEDGAVGIAVVDADGKARSVQTIAGDKGAALVIDLTANWSPQPPDSDGPAPRKSAAKKSTAKRKSSAKTTFRGHGEGVTATTRKAK